MSEHVSFCRFCGAFCGIRVEVEDGRVAKVIGDKHNPNTYGFSCVKGRNLPAQHNHPGRRVLRPLKRQEDGSQQPVAN